MLLLKLEYIYIENLYHENIVPLLRREPVPIVCREVGMRPFMVYESHKLLLPILQNLHTWHQYVLEIIYSSQ